MGHPTIYPTGVTLYDPDRSWNGYTIFQAAGLGALLIDMNGREGFLRRARGGEGIGGANASRSRRKPGSSGVR